MQVDATAWARGESLTGTICVAGSCRPTSSLANSTPNDLVLFIGLPTGSAVVEIRLKTLTGRTLDVSTTAPVNEVKPNGAGCGSTPEVDLIVDSAGRLQPGKPAKHDNPPTPKPTRSLPRPSGLPTP